MFLSAPVSWSQPHRHHEGRDGPAHTCLSCLLGKCSFLLEFKMHSGGVRFTGGTFRKGSMGGGKADRWVWGRNPGLGGLMHQEMSRCSSNS